MAAVSSLTADACLTVSISRPAPLRARVGTGIRYLGTMAAVRRPVLTLVLLALVTFVLGLGRPAITDSDEAYYAEAAREMVESGDWLTPHFNYEDRWQKPVLYYWLTAATYAVTGPGEGAARVWSALSGLALVLLTWVIARRLTRSDDAAWLAGAIVATCFGCFAMARVALPDLPLALFITAAIWMALENRWLLMGAAAGLGFLTKGPVAVAVPFLVLLPIWWHERGTWRIRLSALVAGAAVFALVALPWFAAMTARHGAAYLESFFVGDNLERFATDRFNEPRPIWFYVPILAGGLLPWSAYLAALPWGSIRQVLARRAVIGPNAWRLLVWIGVPLLLFTASVGKQPRYILPVLPPLAIVVAGAITARIASSDPVARRALVVATWITSGLFVLMAALLLRAQALFIGAHPLLTLTGAAALAGAAALLAWTAISERWHALPVRMTVSAAAFLLAVQFGALAGSRPEPVEQVAALIERHRARGDGVGVYQVFARNLLFYTRTPQVALFEDAHARNFLKSPDRVLLVLRSGDLERIEQHAGRTFERLGEVRYLNTADVRLRTILNPDPAQEIRTIVVVTNR